MLSGMDLIDAIRQGRADPPSGIRTLGLDATHRWITELTPGVAVLRWEVDPAYLNLEGAVICSWTVALADQALFFASNTLCEAGESTRTTQLTLQTFENMTDGPITIAARVANREGNVLTGRCDFIVDDEVLAATVDALIEIHR